MKRILLFSLLFCSFLTPFAQISPIHRVQDSTIWAPFYHGVASGDPLSDRVILWTRLTYDTTGTVSVNWTIATDTLLTQVVNSGTAQTDASADWTIKLDATGLQPDSWYYYGFEFMGRKSIVGRTHTTPTGGVDSLRFGVVSCANYEAGYFHVYERLAERNEVDAILHLGDYIYEYESGGYGYIAGLNHDHEPPTEILDLEDYRLRFSQYHLDPQLIFAHQQYPFITVWDDHETANDSWTGGAENHDTLTEGPWADRKASAIQAYMEWLPIRQPDPGSDPERIYRKISYGDLVDLLMIDTRLEGREEQVGTNDPARHDSARSLLGSDQRAWLYTEMLDSTRQWKVIGNQVMVAPMEAFGFPLNTDQWDGYTWERESLFKHVLDSSIQNMVILTGDIHTSWANDLPGPYGAYDENTGANSAGVEFVTPSVTSPAFPFGVPAGIIQFANPHVKYVDVVSSGFILLDINRDRAQSDFWFVPDVETMNTVAQYQQSWYVLDGERHLQQGSMLPPRQLPDLAPRDPENPPLVGTEAEKPVVFGIWPNPAVERVSLEYFLRKPGEVKVRLIDMEGRLLLEDSWIHPASGLYFGEIRLEGLAAGTYRLVLDLEGAQSAHTLVKLR